MSVEIHQHVKQEIAGDRHHLLAAKSGEIEASNILLVDINPLPRSSSMLRPSTGIVESIEDLSCRRIRAADTRGRRLGITRQQDSGGHRSDCSNDQ